MNRHESVVHQDEAGLFATKRSDCGLDFAIAPYRYGDQLDGQRAPPTQRSLGKSFRGRAPCRDLTLIAARLMRGTISLE